MYLRIKGAQSGPLDADAVARDHAAGRLNDAVMSWMDGEPRWISLGRRWPSRRPRGFAGFGIVLALLGAVGIVVACKSHLSMLPFALQTAAVLWAVVLALAALALSGLCWAWFGARRRGKAGLPVALATVLVACLGAWGIAGADLAGRLLTFRQHLTNATVTYDGARHAIRLKGQLGPRLVEQLRAALQAHPDATVLVLDSPGGLVNDALKAAAVVRAHGLMARVDGMCASACVVIWAAAPRRQMTATSRLGLHELRSDIELPQAITHVAMDMLTTRYDAVLRQAGFDAAVLDKARHTPPTSVYWLYPVDVAKVGVGSTIVGEDGAALPRAMAEWLMLAHAFRPPDPIGPLLSTISTHAPEIAYRHAYDLYAALAVRRDAQASRQELNAVLDEARGYALMRASDADTVAWARGYLDAFGGSRRYAWMCEVDTGSSPWTSISRAELHNGLTRGLDQLLAGVGPLDRVHATPLHYSASIAKISGQAWDAARHDGSPGTVSDWKPVDWCTYRAAFLEHAVDLPVPEAAQAVRFIELKHGQVPGS